MSLLISKPIVKQTHVIVDSPVVKKMHTIINIKSTIVPALFEPRGFIFQNEFLTSHCYIKERMKIAF